MKIMIALLASLGLALSVGAQYPATGKAVPAAKDAKKKDEPPAKIEGTEIKRGENGFLGLQVVNSNFKLTFYDAKKKPTPPDVASAVLRWDVKTKAGVERMVLGSGGDPNSLTSARTVKPPYSFKLTIMLMKDAAPADQGAGETYTIDFSQ